MSTTGTCAACSARYDLAAHAPMVSVSCGHSVCAACAEDMLPASRLPSESDEDEEEAACPECETTVAGFVKNVEVLRTLRGLEGSAVSVTNSPPGDYPAPLAYPELDGMEGSFGEGSGGVNIDDEGVGVCDANGDDRRSTFASSSSGRGDGGRGSASGGVMVGSVSMKSSKSARPLEADVSDIMQLIDRGDLNFERSAVNELGSGSSGIVYVGDYTRPHGATEKVAIKCVRASSREAADSEKFRHELNLVSRLADANVVKFVGVAWDDEDADDDDTPPTILLVTELMCGGTLRSALAGLPHSGCGGLEVHSFLSIAISIARGLVYLHAEGYAHRDIKSSNVLLSEMPTPGTNSFPSSVCAKIADFGLSKSIDKLTGGMAYQQSVLEPGRLEATYAYLAPEAFGGDKTNAIRPDEKDDARVQETAKKRDIYALGVLFWEMITGRVPWGGTSLPDVYVRVCVRSDRPTPSLEDSKVPKTLRRLVERCWNQDEKKRPSASSIVDKLERITARLNSVPDSTSSLAPMSSVAVAAAVAGAVTTTVGEPTSSSFFTTTTPKVVVEDAARRKKEKEKEDEAEAGIDSSAQLRRRGSLRHPASLEDSAPVHVANPAFVTKKHSHHRRIAPVLRTHRETPRDSSKLSQASPISTAADPSWPSVSKSVKNVPQHLQHPKRLGAQGGGSGTHALTRENVPRSSSGAVVGKQRIKLLDRPRDIAVLPGDGSVPNLCFTGVCTGESGGASAGRSSLQDKTATDFSRSPSYAGPATTSGALTSPGKTSANNGRSVGRISSERRLQSVNGTHRRESRRDPDLALDANQHVASEDDGEDDSDFGLATNVSYDEGFVGNSAEPIVSQMNTADVLETLSKECSAGRLPGLALAALVSPKHSTSDDVLRAACAALHRVSVPTGYTRNDTKSVSAMEQLTIRKFLKYNGCIPALLGVLEYPEKRHPTTLSYALLAIGNLTAWDLDAHKQFRDARGVVQVSDCMNVHASHLGVQEKGCYALACAAAAYPPRGKNEFLQAGSIGFVSSILESAARNNRLNDAVAKQACAALGAMCAGNPDNAARAALDGALANLIKAFDAFRTSSRTDGGKRNEMHLVGTSFMNLMCHNDNRRRAGSEGGTSLMIRSMRIFRLDADFVEKCLTTLSEFCTFRTNAAHIVQMNGVDDIIAAMVRFKTSVPVQRAGCRTLSALMKASGDQARRRVVHASGSEAILFALERFGATAGIHAAVAVEGCRAIAALCGMESAEEGEILAKRMKKIRTDRAIKQTMQAHRGNQAVDAKAREALQNLSNLRSGTGFFSRIRHRS